MQTRRMLLASSLSLGAALTCFGAQAQIYPSRPITMVVPFAAGGTADTIARILAERMRTSLGQPVTIENVGGAGGSIGTARVARAAPDGYTVVLGSWATHVVNGAVLALQHDALNAFAPVSLVGTQPMLIVTKKTMPANDLKELIAWLKSNPGKASVATAGVGGVSHITSIFFQKETGTRFQFVPYRGSGPAMQDLMAGQIDMFFDQSVSALPLVRAGSIKAFAVAAKSRLPAAPEIPTADEAGLPGFHVSLWNAVWAPKGTPKLVIAKLNDAVVDALAEPTVRQRLADLGQDMFPREQQTPEALRAFHKSEIEKWWPIIKAANIGVE